MLDNTVVVWTNELGKGNRLEFRDFGVFETKLRKARKAQNPKTLEPVAVPEKRVREWRALIAHRQAVLLSRRQGFPVPPRSRALEDGALGRCHF